MANLLGKRAHQPQCDCNLYGKRKKDFGCRPKKSQRAKEKSDFLREVAKTR